MTLTLAQVRTWRPQVLAGVADALSVRRRQLLVAVEDLDLEAAPPSSWTGAAAGAATARHDELRESLAEVTGEVAAVISALDAASAAAQAVCDDLDGVLSFAAGNGCRVDLHTGTVHASDDGADPQVIADRLTGVLSAAVTTDAELTRALHYATAVLGQAGPGAEEPEVTRLPAGATEVEVARWWNELDPAAQQHVLDHHPEWVGNLDGIPAWARDEANRTLLPRYRDELAAEHDRLLDLAIAGPGGSDFFIRAGRTAKMLEGLAQIETVLDRGDRQLLLLDPSGSHELRAAVAVGNVDTADSVGVMTSGFGSSVRDSLASYDARMSSLADLAATESLRQGRVQEIATVSWHGYEAPQVDTGLLLPSRSVLSAAPAEAGAEDLASFLRGVEASRETPAHLVPMGFSYGSVVTGMAMQEVTGADAMVLIGSPGMGTSDLADLQLPEDSAYMIEARRDVIADTGWFGGDPSHLDGLTGLSAQEETIDGVTYTESVGHSSYFEEGSTSQYNLAQILAGQPEHAVEHHGRGIGDWFSQWWSR